MGESGDIRDRTVSTRSARDKQQTGNKQAYKKAKDENKTNK